MTAAADRHGIHIRFAFTDGNDAESAIPRSRWADNAAVAQADLAHIHGWGYPGAIAAAKTARAARKPYILSASGDIPVRHAGFAARIRWLLRDRMLVRAASFIAAVNDAEQRDLRAANVHPDIRVMPYGLDFAAYAGDPIAPPDADSSPLRNSTSNCLLMMGALDPHSGCVGLLKALAELGPLAHGWKVVLAGECTPNWRKALEAAIRRKGAAERVSWVDAADRAAQRRALREADLFVAPATSSGPAIGMLQALASGVPALCTDCVAPPEAHTTSPDRRCLVCPPGKSALREALRTILGQSASQRRLAAQVARDAAAATLDWVALMPRYAAEYASARRA